MRIAFVSLMAGSAWAASEVLWAEAARVALQRGHDVFISVYGWLPRPPIIQELQQLGAQIDPRPLSRWHRRSALVTRATGTFEGLAQFQPDVILVNQGGTYDVARSGSASVLRSTLKRLAVPYLLLCHCEQPAPPEHNLQKARRVFRDAAIVGMVADRLRAISETHLGMPITNARVFHNPVNLKRIERLPWPPQDGPLRFAFVGRLEPVKNLAALIEALAGKQWAQRDWRLSVYGAGPDRDALEQMARLCLPAGRVHFAGHVSDIAAIWAQHHALIMPSRFEGVPLAMVEALLCARPVVATDVGGISEWLEEGRSGFLIQKPTSHEIAAALEKLWNRRDQLQQLGSYAHEHTMRKRDSDPAGTLLQWAEQAAKNPARKYAAIPRIEPIASNVARPLVSVVIPTYEPKKFLIDTVKSVLAQDLGEHSMQIALVDDGSSRTRPTELLASIDGANRIEIHEHSDNLGLGGNWNRAIALARGRYIHVLHQDDTVAPGFYTRLLTGLEQSPQVGMAFSRHAFIDERDRIERISHRERWQAGILNGWLDRIAETQRIQCPAAIVRREAYEKLGGFRVDLHYALDWEMWVRIASHFEVWYEPQVLAHYRRHESAETARLEAAGRTSADLMTAIEMFSPHLPAAERARLQRRAYRRLARSHLRRAAKFLDAGLPQLAMKQIDGARIALARLPKNIQTRWNEEKLIRLEMRV